MINAKTTSKAVMFLFTELLNSYEILSNTPSFSGNIDVSIKQWQQSVKYFEMEEFWDWKKEREENNEKKPIKILSMKK